MFIIESHFVEHSLYKIHIILDLLHEDFCFLVGLILIGTMSYKTAALLECLDLSCGRDTAAE